MNGKKIMLGIFSFISLSALFGNMYFIRIYTMKEEGSITADDTIMALALMAGEAFLFLITIIFLYQFLTFDEKSKGVKDEK